MNEQSPYLIGRISIFISKPSFWIYQHFWKNIMFLHLMNLKRTRKLKRIRTNYRIRLEVVFTITNTPKSTLCFWTWCGPKFYENSQRNGNECSGSSKKRSFFTISNTPRSPLCFWTWCRSKDHETQNGMRRNCLVHRRSVVFLALSTLLETIYHFSLDAVQKTMRAEKYVIELSGSLRIL